MVMTFGDCELDLGRLEAREPVWSEPVLFGREHALAILRLALTRTLGGRGGIVLVRGALGSGKTTFLRAAAATAYRRGLRVCQGTAAPAEARRAWQQVLEDLVPEEDASWGRLRTGCAESIAGICLDAAHKRPLVLLLDDLAWADAAELAVLEHLAQGAGSAAFLVLAALPEDVDPTSPLGRLVSVLVRTLATLDLRLDALGRDATEALARRCLLFDPSSRLIDEIHGRSGGNPLIATLLCDHLNAAWKLQSRHGSLSELEAVLLESERLLGLLPEDDGALSAEPPSRT